MTGTAVSQKPTRLSPLVGVPIVLLLWVLPFHSITVAFFFGVLRTGTQATTLLVAWKEIVAVLLLAVITARAILTRGPRSGVAAPDVAITSLIVIAVVFAVVENPVFGAGIPPKVELFGFRSSVFFMFLYYVGRGAPQMARQSIYIRHAFRVAVVVAVIGVLERLFITPQMLVALGAAAYMTEFLGMAAMTAGNEFGLPSNYFSMVGSVPFRRAGSVFLGGQAFALPFLLLMPAATSWVFDKSRRPGVLAVAGYFCVWAGLLVTLTRMTILVCIIQVLLYFLITRRPGGVVGVGLVTAAVVGIALAVVPGLLTFVWQTVTFQTASSYSHLSDWSRGIVAFSESPWGHGLGSSDQVAVRFGRKAITSDNTFLNYAVDLGVAGLVAHVAILVTLALASWRLMKSSAAAESRILGCTVFLTTVGIALNEASSSPFNSVFLGYNYFLLGGVAVTVLQQLTPPRWIPAPSTAS